jgi:ATP-dependent RNA helicase DeaD
MVSFADLGLREELVKAVTHLGYEQPTLIQERSIPVILAGEDVIGVSNTGSGKTAAFALPLLHNIADGYGIQVAILAPTRELVVQIADELTKFALHLPFIKVATVFGGVAYEPQIAAMKRAHVLVATPGRLLDHLNQGNCALDVIYALVLDEADKMVDMGFVDDVRSIIGFTSEDRQIVLFGATIAGEVERLRDEIMYCPKLVKASEKVDESLLEQYYYNVQPYEKFSLLVHLLRHEPFERIIIFCSARSTVDVVARNLDRLGFKNVLIHGKLAQTTRLKMLETFNKGEVKILVASAVAARGLDIKDVTHVVNYDVSLDPQEYVHRIGRTARAGESGKAVTLLTQRDHDAFSNVFRQYNITPVELPNPRFERVSFYMDDADSDARGPRSFQGRGSFAPRSSQGGRPSGAPRSGGFRPQSNFRR